MMSLIYADREHNMWPDQVKVYYTNRQKIDTNTLIPSTVWENWMSGRTTIYKYIVKINRATKIVDDKEVEIFPIADANAIPVVPPSNTTTSTSNVNRAPTNVDRVPNLGEFKVLYKDQRNEDAITFISEFSLDHWSRYGKPDYAKQVIKITNMHGEEITMSRPASNSRPRTSRSAPIPQNKNVIAITYKDVASNKRTRKISEDEFQTWLDNSDYSKVGGFDKIIEVRNEKTNTVLFDLSQAMSQTISNTNVNPANNPISSTTSSGNKIVDLTNPNSTVSSGNAIVDLTDQEVNLNSNFQNQSVPVLENTNPQITFSSGSSEKIVSTQLLPLPEFSNEVMNPEDEAFISSVLSMDFTNIPIPESAMQRSAPMNSSGYLPLGCVRPNEIFAISSQESSNQILPVSNFPNIISSTSSTLYGSSEKKKKKSDTSKKKSNEKQPDTSEPKTKKRKK